MTSPVPLRRVGASGLLVSAVGLGCNNFGREGTKTETLEGTRAVLDAAIDAGVTFLDTADMYGRDAGHSETLMGEALRGRRDQITLATKFGHSGRDIGYPASGAKASRTLRAARGRGIPHPAADRLDRPVPAARRPTRRRRSKRRSTCSATSCARARSATSATRTSPGWQIAEAHYVAAERSGIPFVSAQNHYSLLARAAEREVLPAVRALRARILPVLPAAQRAADRQVHAATTLRPTRASCGSASTSGRRRRGTRSSAFQVFCDERGITMLEATFGWLLAQPALSSVIAGATSPEQVRANAAAATAWTPTAEDLATIDDLFPLPEDPGARV